MTRIDSRKTEVAVRTVPTSMLVTSSGPEDPRWGQPPASYYDLYFVGDTLRGQRILATEDVYVRSDPDEYPPQLDSRLRPDQSWFWMPQWQAMESEANEDLVSGDYEDFDTLDDFIEDLERLMEE